MADQIGSMKRVTIAPISLGRFAFGVFEFQCDESLA